MQRRPGRTGHLFQLPFTAVLVLTLGFAAPAAGDPGLGLVEAVQMMLDEDPNLSLQEARLRSTRGTLLSARGAFDPVVSSSVSEIETDSPLSEDSSRRTSVIDNSVGVAKRFRSGFSIGPEVSLLRTDGDGPGAANVGTFSLELRQPLLRGRGRAVTTSAELSAEREVAASELDLRQVTAERVLVLANQYWLTRATTLNLDILRESEARARDLVETTRKLIEADVTPAAELVQVEANLVSKETARIAGEGDLFEARQSLGREIGLEADRIAALPLPAEPFPALPAAAAPPAAEAPRFVRAALERRTDLQAARERGGATEALRRAAENALRPQLDVVFTPSYSGLVQGTDPGSFFSPLYRNVPGASSSLSFIVSWPTANQKARGDLLRIDAAREQNALIEERIARQIGADVPAAVDAVGRDAQRLERAREAVRLFERAVENEEKKLRAGSSTLLDVISQRDRLTAARQAEVSAQLSLALSLARLRFETGTLLPESEVAAIDLPRLTTVPLQEAP